MYRIGSITMLHHNRRYLLIFSNIQTISILRKFECWLMLKFSLHSSSLNQSFIKARKTFRYSMMQPLQLKIFLWKKKITFPNRSTFEEKSLASSIDNKFCFSAVLTYTLVAFNRIKLLMRRFDIQYSKIIKSSIITQHCLQQRLFSEETIK